MTLLYLEVHYKSTIIVWTEYLAGWNRQDLNKTHCHLVQEKSVILGHVVSKEGISTDPGKTKVINDWPIPSNISDLRSFLGCVGYYRQFIRDFAKIAEPL